MLDKNLFLYDLAVAAIFKDEGHYLKEWLDYHLLAGVEHFYLYNNDSSDDFREVLAPYVEENLVTLIDFPGRVMQLPAYNDALEKFRFECRYLAFIDLDEFIFPRSNRSVVEILDEVFLSADPNSAGLAINWQFFGSNGLEKADYSRGVLERFTRRAPRDWIIDLPDHKGNRSVKSIVNPRRADYLWNPHFAIYFPPFHAVNENGAMVKEFLNDPVTVDKIAVNHYFTKS
ncbi:MAG: glycosyltransferase family 92 protein, partial [Selenomonadaceae bacterium]|nr:glycosyltransferase family 92 protein [Selenomonadaceae bacterium]